MKKYMAGIFIIFMVLLSISTFVYAADRDNSDELNHEAQDDKKKSTIINKGLTDSALPIVQSYKTNTESKQWEMDASTRFIIPNRDEYTDNSRLKEVVETVSAEFLDKEIPTNSEIEKVYASESEATSKDIVITLDDEDSITTKSNSKEAYKIDIGSNGVEIVAASENAAMYALRTIQQLMVQNDNKLTYGTITDYPDLPERRVHVDMARKHITKDWIIQQIREMSYLKMNTIQLHFSENKGFRIESDVDVFCKRKVHKIAMEKYISLPADF